MTDRTSLGIVTGGSFTEGLRVRMDETVEAEAIRIGDFCVIEGAQSLFFALIQDLALESTDAGLAGSRPAQISPFMQHILRGTMTYLTAEVQPMLMVAQDDSAAAPQPVRTIPLHFSRMVRADAADLAQVFGEDRGSGESFWVGQPLTMDIPIALDLSKFVERSSGIFGSTGTGKSFLTRLILSGIIARQAAVTLVFDMHNEYAYGKQAEGSYESVLGLRDLFPTRVVVYSLDKRSTHATHLRINLDDISTDDVLSLGRELGLPSGTTEANLSLLHRHFGKTWLRSFLDLQGEELSAFASAANAHEGSLNALHRRLQRLRDRDYVSEQRVGDPFNEMMAYLDRGKHIILHFGRHDDVLDQVIVANMVTRRIRQLYQEKTERYQQSNKREDRPRSLVIAVEEAHRFLNPEMARQTIFGTIARELRKYFVTLLIVDQRPSGIDDEILSQVGTRVSGKLLDERDLEAVLSGVSNRSALRSGLASLDTKQQVMIFGHAVPMPIALRTRSYDATFFREIRQQASHLPSLPDVPPPAAPPAEDWAAPPPDESDFKGYVDRFFGDS